MKAMHLHTDSEPDFDAQIKLHALVSAASCLLFSPRMEKETLVLEGVRYDLRNSHAALQLLSACFV